MLRIFSMAHQQQRQCPTILTFTPGLAAEQAPAAAPNGCPNNLLSPAQDTLE